MMANIDTNHRQDSSTFRLEDKFLQDYPVGFNDMER